MPQRDDDDESDDDTEPCPYCGKPIYDGSERCPHCENYITEEDVPSHKPMWVIIGAVLALGVAAMWVLGR